MILKIRGFAIILLFFVCTLYSCNCDKDIIDTYALVVPNEFRGDIVIFFEQDFDKGKIDFKDCRHYFYVSDSSSFFYTSLKSGEGFIEFYDEELNRKNYSSSMHIKNAPPMSFQVIGGAYRKIVLESHEKEKQIYPYVVFKAGIASEISDNWYLPSSSIMEIYKDNLPSNDNSPDL